MRDSQVLNEPVLDLVHLDYAHSLESIERIEIIRGPGTSIYGNAAMGAVINLITRRGSFSSVRVRAGDNQQLDFDAAVARQEDDYFYTLYGRFVSTEGQRRDLSPDQDPSAENPKQGIHRAEDFPSNVNLGLIAGKGEFRFNAIFQRDDMNIHWGLRGENTNAVKLVSTPRFQMDSVHLGIDYAPELMKGLTTNFSHYYDVVDLDIIKNTGEISPAEPRGSVLEILWQAHKLGLNYTAQYVLGEAFSLLAGGTFEQRDYRNSSIIARTASSTTDISFFEDGDDHRGALFGQVDWHGLDWLQVVAGGRYDFFSDYGDTFNPRLALLLKPRGGLSVTRVLVPELRNIRDR